VSSNPTNLVLSGAFSLTFLTYTSSLILPFLAAAVLTYPFLVFLLFRSAELIPSSIELPTDDAEGNMLTTGAALVDKQGAIFGSVLLIMTLGALVGTSTVAVPVWEVTVPPAVIMLARDLWHDWKAHVASRPKRDRPHSVAENPDRPDPAEKHDASIELESFPTTHTGTSNSIPLAAPVSQPPPVALSTLVSLSPLTKTFPTVHTIVSRLPVALMPFAFLMFILVQGLASRGWVQVFASFWQTWVDKTGPVGAVAGMAIGAGLMCNV